MAGSYEHRLIDDMVAAWRAPIDNDYGNKMPTRLKSWKEASENQTLVSFMYQQHILWPVSIVWPWWHNMMEKERNASRTLSVLTRRNR